jgi:hypothetical protein
LAAAATSSTITSSSAASSSVASITEGSTTPLNTGITSPAANKSAGLS